MAWQLAPARRTRPAWLIVLALHGLAGWLLSQQLHPRPGARPGELLRIRLLPLPVKPAASPAAPPLPSPRQTHPQPSWAPSEASRSDERPAEPPPLGLTDPGTAPRSTAAPLNLSLPPQPTASAPWRNPALADERSNTPRAGMEQRIARAIGGEADQPDEIINPGKRRIRYHGNCYDVQQSRNAQLDPYNQSVYQPPAQGKSCDK